MGEANMKQHEVLLERTEDCFGFQLGQMVGGWRTHSRERNWSRHRHAELRLGTSAILTGMWEKEKRGDWAGWSVL